MRRPFVGLAIVGVLGAIVSITISTGVIGEIFHAVSVEVTLS